jgi:hypothetical protein
VQDDLAPEQIDHVTVVRADRRDAELVEAAARWCRTIQVGIASGRASSSSPV